MDYGFIGCDGIDMKEETPLINACILNNADIVKCLVENDTEINRETHKKILDESDEKNGNTPSFRNYEIKFPLTIACENNNETIVKLLIEYGADVNIFADNETPLSIAYKNKNKTILKYLVEHGALKNTVLKLACRDGNEEIVHYLVEQGADVNIGLDRYFDGFDVWGLYGYDENNYFSKSTPLVATCKSENEFIVKYLIEHGADVNKMDNCGDLPLVVACKNENEPIVKYLVEHGADINKDDDTNCTPLIAACNKRNENIIKYLVEHGADVDEVGEEYNYYSQNYEIVSPLMVACSIGNLNIVKYLVEHGADINKKIDNKYTALTIACENIKEKENEDIIKYLINNGADLNVPVQNDKTAIFFFIK